MTIAERISEIRKELNEGVTLIAVSKTKPLEMVKEAVSAGETHFGENYVAELVEKSQQIPEANWHFIGHLESNKVKMLEQIPNLTIHSVDSYSLAEKIAKILPGTPVFLQINISGEDSKSGFDPESLQDNIQRLHALELNIVGFMCIGEPGEGDRDFPKIVALRDALLPGGKLSMGMSADWELAQQLGSNYVRIGSAIFGERQYPSQSE